MEEQNREPLQQALDRVAKLEAEVERLKEENARLRAASLQRSNPVMSSKLREALRE
ncbi:hypothetical protein RAC89_21965 [Paenibacillus sp. GD4]|uniref:hypothetical protein n=1 Tax=Paenibacillus sp. GD4 TaxID=3068890 RepID=UPI0027967F2F|nr:hypothetical protein [Paenibacillus sp. GD4]MDQ1913064.1 hypothetical protein [Paenibacillus sp. GD4]